MLEFDAQTNTSQRLTVKRVGERFKRGTSSIVIFQFSFCFCMNRLYWSHFRSVRAFMEEETQRVTGCTAAAQRKHTFNKAA